MALVGWSFGWFCGFLVGGGFRGGFRQDSFAFQEHAEGNEESFDDCCELVPFPSGNQVSDCTAQTDQQEEDEGVPHPVEDVVVHEVGEDDPEPVGDLMEASFILQSHDGTYLEL